jgi:hypothetical protein
VVSIIRFKVKEYVLNMNGKYGDVRERLAGED